MGSLTSEPCSSLSSFIVVGSALDCEAVLVVVGDVDVDVGDADVDVGDGDDGDADDFSRRRFGSIAMLVQLLIWFNFSS